MNKDDFPREKRWRDLDVRSEKVRRAKQLGIDYPRKDAGRLGREAALNVLFVCSKNQWRSPTAERVFERDPLMNVKSRGTSRSARRTVTAHDLKWADVVLVMERKHAQRLRADFPGAMKYQELHVLDIPDDYRFMDPELVELLQAAVPPLLRLGEDG